MTTTYRRAFDGYNATTETGERYLVRRTDEPLDGVRGPWWTVVPASADWSPMGDQMALSYFATLRDAKASIG